MPVRASVLPQPAPGHAILRVGDLDAPPEGLTLSIQRQQGPESHLGEDGWRRTEAWLRPDQVMRIKGMLEFHLGPSICDRLAGIATIRLRIREPDIGVVATTVVAWPAMLTSGAVDPTSKAPVEESPFRFRRPPPTVQPPPAPAFEPESAEPPPRPIPELRAAREPMPQAARPGLVSWLLTALALIVVAGGGYYVYATYFQKNGAQVAATAPSTNTASEPAATAAPAATPTKSVRDTVAEYLATKPSSEAMLAKGQEYAAAGNFAGAFLVWREAAALGNPQAEVEIANFFDPLAPTPKTGFTPDGARAAEWYERAALAGNAEAQRRLGLLYAMGAAGVPADPAKAKSWLQQAAQQNDIEAKKALEQLSKK